MARIRRIAVSTIGAAFWRFSWAFANAVRVFSVGCETVGKPQYWTTRSVSFAGSLGDEAGAPASLHERRHEPARAEGRRVEPARVIPAADVRRVEELLPGRLAERPPDRVVDELAAHPQQAGVVDDRRLDHARPRVEGGVHQDRLDDRLDLAAGVDRLQAGQRVLVERRRDEVAPELVHEVRRVQRMAEAEVAGVLPAPVAGVAEERLCRLVVAALDEVDADGTPFVTEPVQPVSGACVVVDVGLGVGAAVGAEREELHHLAPVVLVRRALDVLVAVQPDEHRRVDGHAGEQRRERAERVRAEELVLVQHQLLLPDALVRGREPGVPDERHPLDERRRRPDHPVEPPEVVVADHVTGSIGAPSRSPAPARRASPAPPDGSASRRLPGDRARELLGVALPRAEARPPEQALGLLLTERPGHRSPLELIRRSERRAEWKPERKILAKA